MDKTDGPYMLGAELWPGLSKLLEECGEVQQVVGKIIGIGGDDVLHWDGTNLRERLQEELSDLKCAIDFVMWHNDLDQNFMGDRYGKKWNLYCEWHQKHKERMKTLRGVK